MNGQPTVKYTLEVNLAITQQYYGDDGRQIYGYGTGNRLEVKEQVQLGAMDFLAMTHVLANLHDSVTALRHTEESKDSE